ncbi:MAG: putative lipid II flippase FtsW [Lachnospiraceae bacterium]|nr:putative lipid II flippase FtsW [Lachnospiraceae bacterium]
MKRKPSQPNMKLIKVKKGKNIIKGSLDWPLVIVVCILLVFGLLMLYSASSYNAQLKFGTPAFYVKNQLKNTIIGLIAMFVVAFIPQNVVKKTTFIIYGFAILAMGLLLSPLGEEYNGATRWLNLKVTSIQPSEIVKIAVILAMAYLIGKFAQYLYNVKMFYFVFAFCGVGAGLTVLLSDDLGTGIIILGIGFVMLLVSCERIRWLLITYAGIAVAGVSYMLLRSTKRVRIEAWLHIDQYADDKGYQITQALYAIGSGGFMGKGLGKSTQKLGFIPESENDMIFSIISEELGILGGIVLIALFALLIWRMKKIYDNSTDIYSRAIVAGVASHIAIQTFINIGVVSNLLPNTGVPLPFISFGGSAVMFLLMEIGLVLAVSRMREQTTDEKRRTYYQQDKERGTESII